MIRIKNRGQSANLVLLVGIIIATAVSAFAVYTTFDDIVVDLINGDPEMGAREFATNMDIAASSPNELTIYTSTPMTVMGYPAYGTILINADDQKIRVHPYPQDLMKMQIQKSMHGEISAETAAGAYALYELRSSKVAMKAKQELFEELSQKAAKGAEKATSKSGADRLLSNAVKYRRMEVKLADKIAAGKTGGIGRRVARKVVIAPIKFLDTITLRIVSKSGKYIWKELFVKSSKSIGRMGYKAGAKLIRHSAAYIGFEITDIAEESAEVAARTGEPVSVSIWALIFTSRRIAMAALAVDWYFTIAPIEHSIRNARHARTKVADKFGEYNFNTGDIPIHVAKPNCKSARYAIDSEVDLPVWMLGFIPGINEMVGSVMNIPMSKATEEMKEYEIDGRKTIINDGDECYDAHNVYLNQDGSFFYKGLGAIAGAIDGTGSTAISEGYVAGINNPITHPYTTLVIIPSAWCVTKGMKEPKDGMSCLLAYDLLAIGAWSNNEFYNFEDGATSMEEFEDRGFAGNLWLNGIVATIAGVSRQPSLYIAFTFFNNVAPLDSATLFSYITGSPSLIDSQKEYYMEDAVLVSISKKYDENGNPILIVDKEI